MCGKGFFQGYVEKFFARQKLEQAPNWRGGTLLLRHTLILTAHFRSLFLYVITGLF